MSALSNYLENKIIDYVFRGQTFVPPANIYIALLTSAANDADGSGVEVSGGGYARVAVPTSLAAWAGTQAAGSTVASTGTSGTTSNNASISFATPTAGWGNVVAFEAYDALTGGNPLFYGTLSVAKTINIGDSVSFAPGTLSLQIDSE